MNNTELTQTPDAPQGHRFVDDDHFRAWALGIEGFLSKVRSKLEQPQTASDRAILKERESRYVGYLAKAGWPS